MTRTQAALIPQADDAHICRDHLDGRLRETRALSEDLAAPLSDEDQVVQAMDDASPTKWHLAHTTWFFETFVLAQFLPGYARFNDRFEYCFNSYYEAVGPRHPRPSRGLLTRPSADAVRAYRAHVNDALGRLFEHDIPDEAARLIELGINHEKQHQELLLTDVLSLFASQPLRPAYRDEIARLAPADPEPLSFTSFAGGLFEIGHAGDGFSYDNEGPRHEQLIRPFKLANRCVTNGEWIAFMEDGGYESAALWLADGWNLIREEGWRTPLYFEEDEGGYKQMSLKGLRPLDLAAPVTHVSYFEADAFARWAGYRLPSEFEWEHASQGLAETGRTLVAGNLSPKPAPSGPGLTQMFGDVWEWTASAYLPYPGYKPVAGAVGEYNGKFMCNQFVLKGGSCATPKGHIRRTYRNFFYPHQRWQFTGLRLAADA
ncbi:MAG: ergothioneine biosynthesis protein EgtB [Pseudomonadota bacterium]